MKKLFLLLLTISVLLSSCEDEAINDMNTINAEWEASSASIEEVDAIIDEIMMKYKATAIDFSQIDNNSDNSTITKIVLLDGNRKKILNLSSEDQVRLDEAMARKSSLMDKQSKLADVDNVFTVVEQQPAPKDGMPGFYQYVATTLKYPEQARKIGVEGKVFVQFVVTEFGEITEVTTVKGIGAGCDKAAEEVIKNAEPWNPGMQKGEPVKVRMVIPVSFKLS